MATEQEVYQSINDHINFLKEKLEKALKTDDIDFQNELQKRIERARNYAEDYKNDYNL